jgi:hypothetical protein
MTCAEAGGRAQTPDMDLPLTLALAAGFAALTAFCGWRGARPLDIVKGPRIVPWRMLMLLSATACIMMLVHLVNLAGMQTGRR